MPTDDAEVFLCTQQALLCSWLEHQSFGLVSQDDVGRFTPSTCILSHKVDAFMVSLGRWTPVSPER